MELDRICKTLKVFFIVSIVVFSVFLAAFIFNFDTCYHFLCNNIIEELSFKNFFKIKYDTQGYSLQVVNITNAIILIISLILSIPLMYGIMSKLNVQSGDFANSWLEIVICEAVAFVLVYFPIKLLLLGLAYAFTFFASDAGVYVLFGWFCLAAIGYVLLLVKLGKVANALKDKQGVQIEYVQEDYEDVYPEYENYKDKMVLVGFIASIVVICFLIVLFV